MIPSPWKSFSPPQPGKDYVAMLSFLPLKQYRTIPRFIRLSAETQKQLAKSEGLIGYSLMAELLARRFWTLSVWKDRESLMKFVHEIPHSEIMKSLAPHMGKTRFVQWTLQATEIPPRWNDAKPRIRS